VQLRAWKQEKARRERERELRMVAAMRRAKLERFPVHAVGLLDISGLDQVQGWRWIVRAIENTPQLHDALQQLLYDIEHQHEGPHRPRKPGNQIYAYFHFALSGKVNIEPWHDKVEPALFAEWGFEIPDGQERPPYHRLYDRFCELEEFWERIRELAEIAIAIAAGREPRVGHLTMADGTEQITSAALYHVCQPGQCPTGRAGERVGGIGQQPRGMKLGAEEAADHRHAADEHPRTVNMEKLVADEALRDLLAGKIDDARIVPAEGRKPARLRFRTSSGHWWETRDLFAGVRYYAGKNGAHGKFWHGKLQVKIVDHFTGAPLALIDIPAGTNECDVLLPLMHRVCETLGYSSTMTTTDSAHWFDRSCSIPLLEMGTQHVGGDRTRYARDEHVNDQGGVHCEHCGGPCEELEYESADMSRRYRCMLGLTPQCSERFRKTAKDAPRKLGPVPATRAESHYASKCHSNKENAQRLMRSSFEVTNKHYDHVPRRISPFVQTLRAHIGLLITWVRICMRIGAIEVEGFTQQWDGKVAVYQNLIEEAEAEVAKAELRGLQIPFGKRAAELGFGPLDHPPPLAAAA
jgi:hypothetical protein